MRSTRRFVQDFIERMRENGHIYEARTPGLYCVGHETFISEDELVDGKCPDHGTVPEWIEEQNWFFRLSDLPAAVARPLRRAPDFVLPRFRYNEGAEPHRRRGSRTSASAGRASHGACRSRGTPER